MENKLSSFVTAYPEKYIGCNNCMLACPFGAITLNDIDGGKVVNLATLPDNKLFCIEKMVANKCDLCSDSDDGPACVRVCHIDAFRIVSEEELNSSIKNKRRAATARL